MGASKWNQLARGVNGALHRQDDQTILGEIARLTDSQLDVISPTGSFGFCGGQRTLERVLASLLKHPAPPARRAHTAIR